MRKVVSGGQTGVDRAALDAARALGLPSAAGVRAGAGPRTAPIPAEYPLRETPGED